MINYRQTASSLNEAIKMGIRDRNSIKKIPASGDFYIKAKDDNGLEYIIRYY